MGQRAAGDDGVGHAVVEELRRRGVSGQAELLSLSDAMELVTLLEQNRPMVVVDAVLSAPSGRVMALDPDDLSLVSAQPASSHGMGVAQAIGLARALTPQRALPDVRIVA